MKLPLLAILTATFTAASALASGAADGPSAALPPNAMPGQCYARVARPAEYRDVVEQVLEKDAYETVKIIPARYEMEDERVMVTPSTTRIIEVPARYETVAREIVVEAARQEWRRGDCNPKAIVDHATGECWCLVDVPARTKTVHERMISEPATTRSVEVPAEYQTVAKRVMVEPERMDRTLVPAVYGTRTRRELVREESVEWVQIDCEASKERTRRPAGNGWFTFPRLDNRVH